MAFFGNNNSQYLLLYTDEMQYLKKNALINKHIHNYV